MNKKINVEGLEVITTKRTEIDKEKFFKLLAKHEELNLTIDRVGKIIKSKYPDKKTGKCPFGCFIDYIFTVENIDYEIGIYYNVGFKISEDKYKLTSGMYIFKILELIIDLSDAEEIGVTEDLIDSLTGTDFIATLGTSKNGFYIKPVELV